MFRRRNKEIVGVSEHSGASVVGERKGERGRFCGHLFPTPLGMVGVTILFPQLLSIWGALHGMLNDAYLAGCSKIAVAADGLPHCLSVVGSDGARRYAPGTSHDSRVLLSVTCAAKRSRPAVGDGMCPDACKGSKSPLGPM